MTKTSQQIAIQKSSFRSLFDAYPNGIVIPKIQRDYAQGRKEEEEIRRNFLNALYKGLTNNGLTLDFIYGSQENNALLPLDGQQRLTTLFLLHWLVAMREGIDPEKTHFLKKFQYETRPDTALFCQLLTTWKGKCEGTKISECIMNSPDYLLSWDHDPTITSMLHMLDALDEKFYGQNKPIDQLWDKLDQINFYCKDIKDLGETDDIYIKMNSRGKPLTNFEHFKSRFDDVTKGILQNEIDVSWTDFLWKLFKNDSNRNVNSIDIDTPFLALFHFLASILMLKSSKKLAPADHFAMIDEVFSQPANVEELKKFFNVWSAYPDSDALFNTFLTSDQNDPRVNIPLRRLNILKLLATVPSDAKQLNLKEHIYLWAFTIFLLNRALVSNSQFMRRLRILRNLVENSIYEIRVDNMDSIIEDTENLILNETINLARPSFNANQKEEEVRKLKWLANLSPEALKNHEDKLALLENRNVLYGSTALIGTQNYDLFDTFIQFFSNATDWNSLGRALLTCGQFCHQENAHCWRAGANKCEDWRALLSPRFNQGKRLDYIAIMRKFLEALKHQNNPQAIITAYLADSATIKDWSYYLIKYPLITIKATHSKYYWNNPNAQYDFYSMATPSSINGRHWQSLLIPVEEFFNKQGTTVKLGEYGQRLHFMDNNYSLDNLNDRYNLYKIEDDGTQNFIKSFLIPQKNAIDQVDRIEFICNALQSYFQEDKITLEHVITVENE